MCKVHVLLRCTLVNPQVNAQKTPRSTKDRFKTGVAAGCYCTEAGGVHYLVMALLQADFRLKGLIGRCQTRTLIHELPSPWK